MKTIKIKCKGVFIDTIVDDEDFEFLNQWNWFISNSYVFRAKRYGERKYNKRKIIWMHREVYERHNGTLMQGEQVDHIDCNKLNNTSSNLRKCSFKENQRNKKKNKSTITSSKYKGVSFQGDKWRAYIVLDDKQINLGRFDTEEEAAKVYNEASKLYHKEFANFNKELDSSDIKNVFYKVKEKSCPYKGVSIFRFKNGKIKWRAAKTIEGKRINLGLHDTQELAKEAIEEFMHEG